MHILIAALHRPSKPTGVCRHAVNLAQCLADIDKVSQVTLIIGTWQKQYFEALFNFNSPKIKLVSINIKNSSISRNNWFLFGLPKVAKYLHPDIIHLSFPLPFIRSLFSCPVMTTVHDLYPYECPENFGFPQVLFNRFFLKQCITNSDGFSCVSQITQEKLNYYFPNIKKSKKFQVNYNYVDFSQIKPQVPQNINIEKIPFILSVAQHRKNKNLDLLIDSYSSLIKAEKLKSNTKLIIVGSPGPETENLYKQINQLSLQDQVLIISSLSDEELCWLYKNCELFAIPSSTEGFCLPLAEALYLSCKVVCSDIPIFKEIAASNCNYFKLEGDIVKNISEAILNSTKQSSDRSNYINLKFDKLEIAHRYLNLYQTLIGV
jgi:glycosyltransferase involved in cell wall biosynthesis